MEPTAAVGGSEGQPGSPPAGDSPPVSPTRQDRKKQSSIGRRLRDLFRTSSHDEGQAPAAAAATTAAAGGDQTGFGPLDSRLVSPARSSGGALFSRSRPGSMRGTETRQQRSASLRATIALDTLLPNLDGDNSMTTRISAIRRLQEQLVPNMLTNAEIERLWLAVRDLVQRQHPARIRQAVLTFLGRIISSQSEDLSLPNSFLFFQLLSNHEPVEDTPSVVVATTALCRTLHEMDLDSDTGASNAACEAPSQTSASLRDLGHLLGPFLLDLMPRSRVSGAELPMCHLLTVVFRRHATSLDMDSLVSLVDELCHWAVDPSLPEQVTSVSLKALDGLVADGAMPFPSLSSLLQVACRRANTAKHTKFCFDMVESVLNISTYIGLLGVHTLCEILCNNELCTASPDLARGAVYMLTHSAWGNMKVVRIEPPLLKILQAFEYAARRCSPTVNFEVAHSLCGLLSQCGDKLSATAWDFVLNIWQFCDETEVTQTAPQMATIMDTLLSMMETLYTEHTFAGDTDRLFELVEYHPRDRDMTIALNYKVKTLHPSEHGWLLNVQNMMQRYFRDETRPDVKIKVLELLRDVLRNTRHVYDDRVISGPVLHFLKDLPLETDIDVQTRGVTLLAEIAAENGTYYGSLFPLVKNMLQLDGEVPETKISPPHSPLARSSADQGSARHKSPRRAEQSDDLTHQRACQRRSVTLRALLRLFESSFMREPATHALSALEAIVECMQLAYTNGANPNSWIDVDTRRALFESLLRIKCNKYGNVYLGSKAGGLKAKGMSGQAWAQLTDETSPYFGFGPIVSLLDLDEPVSPDAKVVMKRESSEVPNDMLEIAIVRQRVRHAMVELLKLASCELEETGSWPPKEAILSALPSLLRCTHMAKVVGNALCPLSEAVANLTELYSSSSGQLTATGEARRTVFANLYEIISVVVVHKQFLNYASKMHLVACLKLTLHQNTAPCVRALTSMTVESQDSITRAMPVILDTLLKLKSLSKLKLLVLEFLALVGRLPPLHKNMRANDFMAVLSICLESTEPTNDDSKRFLTDLAYHVIAVWFTAMPLAERKATAPFVVERLASYPRLANGSLSLHPQVEACIDLIARYTFSDVMEDSLRTRPPAVEKLLEGASTLHWMYGHTLLSIAAAPSGWAEFTVRRPTGKITWMQRLQNPQLGEHGSAIALKMSQFLAAESASVMAEQLRKVVYDSVDFFPEHPRMDTPATEGTDSERPRGASFSSGGTSAATERASAPRTTKADHGKAPPKPEAVTAQRKALERHTEPHSSLDSYESASALYQLSASASERQLHRMTRISPDSTKAAALDLQPLGSLQDTGLSSSIAETAPANESLYVGSPQKEEASMKGRRTSRRRSSRALEHNDSMRSLDVSQSASADEDMFEMSTAEHGGDSESEGGRPGRTRSGDSSGENSDDEDEADNDTDNADSRSPGKRLEGKATRRSRGKRRSRTKQQQQRHQNSESASLPEESPTPPHTVQHAAQRSKVSGGTTTSSRAVPAAAAAAAAMDASSTAAQPQDAAVDNTDNTPTATSAAAPEGGPKAAQRDPSPSKTAGSLTHKRTSSGSAAAQLVAEDKVRTHSFAASTTVTFDKSKPSSASTFPATPPPATKPTSQRGADAAKAALASAASAAASTSASSAPVAKCPLSVSVSTARQSSDTTGTEAAHKDAPPAPRPRLTDTVLPLEGETDEQFRRRCASLDPGALRRMRQAQAANAAKAAKTAKAAKAAKAAEVSDARKEQTDAKAAEAGDAGSKSAQRHGDPQTAADRDSRPRRISRQRSQTLSHMMPENSLGAAEKSAVQNTLASSPKTLSMSVSSLHRQDSGKRRRVASPSPTEAAANFFLLNMSPMPYFTETLLPVSVSAKGRGEGSASDLERALRMLDQTVPLDTHRIGVIYVKDGQTAESDILANASGSARYLRFLESLGEITRLRDAPEAFTGGLDVKEDRDGEFSFCYRHGITSVIYHVATMMPTKEGDTKCINKKLHIGNDYVTIVFNDSTKPFKRGTLSGAVNFVDIVVTPVDDENYRINVNVKEGFEKSISAPDDRLVSGSSAGLLVRQLAINANLAALTLRKSTPSWIGRLKQLKTIRERHTVPAARPAHHENFSAFTQ